MNYVEKSWQFVRKNKSVLKTQQRFKIEIHHIFTEEINRFALSLNDAKRIQLVR